MKKIGVGLASVAVFALLGVVTFYGQEHRAGQHAQQTAGSGSSSGMSGTIFCPAKSTGQLCDHGTVDVLKVSGAKRQSWSEAANRYNKSVEAATKQLLQDAKATLSPEQYAQVEKWFAKGLNPEINRLLTAK